MDMFSELYIDTFGVSYWNEIRQEGAMRHEDFMITSFIQCMKHEASLDFRGHGQFYDIYIYNRVVHRRSYLRRVLH